MTLHSLCICRLTLTCILREISTKPRGMLTDLYWSSLTAPGLYLMPTGLLCCLVSTALLHQSSPTAFSGFLFPTLWMTFPCLLPVASRSRAHAFVWFRAKTNKKIVCLVHSLHSVTTRYEHKEIIKQILCATTRTHIWIHPSTGYIFQRATKNSHLNHWWPRNQISSVNNTASIRR